MLIQIRILAVGHRRLFNFLLVLGVFFDHVVVELVSERVDEVGATVVFAGIHVVVFLVDVVFCHIYFEEFGEFQDYLPCADVGAKAFGDFEGIAYLNESGFVGLPVETDLFNHVIFTGGNEVLLLIVRDGVADEMESGKVKNQKRKIID